MYCNKNTIIIQSHMSQLSHIRSHSVVCVYRFVYIWDTTSRRILYKLPGHAGSVNEVAFHPEEPIGESNYCFFLRIHAVIHVRRMEQRYLRSNLEQRAMRSGGKIVLIFMWFCQNVLVAQHSCVHLTFWVSSPQDILILLTFTVHTMLCVHLLCLLANSFC